MYYLDHEIEISIDFLNKKKMKFHTVSSIKVDYVNKLVNFELSSYLDRSVFDDNPTNAFVSFLDLNGCPNFSIDPILWVMRVLISNPDSPFYRAEIKNDDTIEQLNIPTIDENGDNDESMVE